MLMHSKLPKTRGKLIRRGKVQRREKLVRVLTEGSYWLGFGESIVSQSLSEKANLTQLDNKQMAMHDLLQDYITVVDVKDNQIVICNQVSLTSMLERSLI